MKLALILGSAREGRFCDTVARWATREITSRGDIELDVIDPLTLDLPRRIEATPNPTVTALAKRIARADAYVVITPEYNHGYPAALKELIDSAYSEWNAKPVGFISYGGLAGGLRAVEQLRLVFAELHAVTMRDSVSLAHPWRMFDRDGALLDPEPVASALATMLAQLRWWSRALKTARATEPYPKRLAG